MLSVFTEPMFLNNIDTDGRTCPP